MQLIPSLISIHVCLGLALAQTVSLAPPEELLETMAAKTFTASNETILPYRLLLPPDAGEKAYPVFLCMHGAGGRGADNAKTIRHSPWAIHGVAGAAAQQRHPCIVIAPQCPGGKRWVDRNWNESIYSVDETPITAEQTAVIELLRSIIKEHGADASRVYVGGFSMGGYGTWDLLARFPETFAAAVPVCGGVDPSRAEAMKSVAIWAFHGEKDNVVPPAGSRAAIKALKQAGATVKYTEFANTTHNAWTPAWNTPKLLDWVFEQKRP